MSNSSSSSSSGIGFAGGLTILFIALKLTGVIGWSWWWVLAPVLITWGVGLAILLVVLTLSVAIAARWPKSPW